MSNEHESNEHRSGPESSKNPSILDGVANILGRLGELAEKGEELRKQVGGKEGEGADAKGVFDFAVRFGNVDSARPSGSGRPGQKSSQTVKPLKERQVDRQIETPVEKVRAAQIDVFEEDDHLLVIAEMPGATADSIHISIDNGKLALRGKNSNALFQGEVPLPEGDYNAPVESLNNGILEVRIEKKLS